MIRRLFSDASRALIQAQKFRQARYVLECQLTSQRQSSSGGPPSPEELRRRLGLFKRIGFCELKLGNFTAAEMHLEAGASEIEAVVPGPGFPPEVKTKLLFEHYEVLLLYLVQNNLTKAIRTSERLIGEFSDPQFLAQVNFYLGLAEILRESIFDAKDFLYKTLSSKLPLLRLGMAFNNLGVACWWDRFPNYSSLTADEELGETDEEEYTEKLYKSKVSDFSYAVDFFQTAIYKFEVLFETAVAAREDSAAGRFSIGQVEDIELTSTTSVRVKNVLELINNDFLSTDDQLYFSGLLEKGELFKNPLSAVPLFNLAEMTLSTTETPDQRQQGLIYLHFAFRMLHHNLLINRRHGRAAGAPGPEVSPKVRELYSDHEGLYRSLYIRCLTIMSLVDSLEKAG